MCCSTFFSNIVYSAAGFDIVVIIVVLWYLRIFHCYRMIFHDSHRFTGISRRFDKQHSRINGEIFIIRSKWNRIESNDWTAKWIEAHQKTKYYLDRFNFGIIVVHCWKMLLKKLNRQPTVMATEKNATFNCIHSEWLYFLILCVCVFSFSRYLRWSNEK